MNGAWIRRTPLVLVAAVVVTAAAAVAGLGYAGDEQPRVVPPPTADEVRMLRTAALEIAARNGETHPRAMRIVAAPRKAVVDRLMGGAEVDTDQDVYVVAMAGTFTAREGRVPPGVPQPSGSHLVLVFDAATKTLIDLSILNTAAALEQFGTPTEAG